MVASALPPPLRSLAAMRWSSSAGNVALERLVEHCVLEAAGAGESPVGLNSSRRQASRVSNSSWASWGRTVNAPESPCLVALRAAAALPSWVFGPVDRDAFSWLAVIWARVAMVSLPYLYQANWPKRTCENG